MNQKITIFTITKSFLQFLKIVIMFFIILHIFYWIQNLLGSVWGWMNFSRPILEFFINLSAKISDGYLDFFGTVFEYKYFIAIGMYIVLMFLMNVLCGVVDHAESRCDDIRRFAKKVRENSMNKNMAKEQQEIEKKINKYKILVKTTIKRNFAHAGMGYDLEEQNRIMNKFLMEKTGVKPVLYEDGFLYSFNNFDTIDSTLEIFFRLIKSEAPLNYMIAVQTVDESDKSCLDKLKIISELNVINKISMLSDTSYRYRFNEENKFKTSQLGVYQKDIGNIELWEFVAD